MIVPFSLKIFCADNRKMGIIHFVDYGVMMTFLKTFSDPEYDLTQ